MTVDSFPSAVGYLRIDVSGTRRPQDELQISSLATRLGYDLRRIAVFGPETDRPLHRLRVLVSRLEVDAVVTPNLDHLDGAVPDNVLEIADVITVNPEETYARWIIPPDAPADMGSR